MFMDSYHCVMCVEQVDEDIHHLFFSCPFASACWIYLILSGTYRCTLISCFYVFGRDLDPPPSEILLL